MELAPDAHREGTEDYFNELLTEVNLVLSWGPMPCTVAIIANAIPVAIRQYSIAVAPVSSARKSRMVFILERCQKPLKRA